MSQAQVNMNGDTLETLQKQQRDIMEAAQSLLDTIAKSMPHGRNYQTVENSAEALQKDRAAVETMLYDVQAYIDDARDEYFRLEGRD